MLGSIALPKSDAQGKDVCLIRVGGVNGESTHAGHASQIEVVSTTGD